MKAFTIDNIREEEFNTIATRFKFFVDQDQQASDNGTEEQVERYNTLPFETKMSLHGKFAVDLLNEEELEAHMNKIASMIERAKDFAKKTHTSFNLVDEDQLDMFYNIETGEWEQNLYYVCNNF